MRRLYSAGVADKNGQNRGSPPERMKELTRIRLERMKTDPSARGGRPRTKYTRAEAEAAALERMMPKALKVLESQLDSKDLRVQQSAAIKVLEYVKGKPVQQINQQLAQVTEIRYESAAWNPSTVLGGGFPEVVEIDESDLLELPEPEE